MTTRSYSYYPGCSAHGSSKEYEVATRLVFQTLGIELREIPDWTCCGASSAHTTSRLLGYALPARNLQIAEQRGLPVTTPCPACFARLKTASHHLKDMKVRDNVAKVLGKDLHNSVPVLPILGAVLPEEVAAAIRRPLDGLKVACYYGCAFVKPNKTTEFDDEENPETMDRLMVAAGAQTIDWAYKTECCGASLTVTRPEVVRQLSGRILAAAKRLGADCVVVACPMCQGNLDQRQGEIADQFGWDVKIPVIYFTQLLAIALGHDPADLGFGRHLSDPLPLLRAKGFATSIGGR